MTVLEMFEKVNLVCPVEQRNFFNYLNDSVDELFGMYGDIAHTLTEGEHTRVLSLQDEACVLPLYHGAIVDNILFLCGQGENYRGGFLNKALAAWKHYWNAVSKGRIFGIGG